MTLAPWDHNIDSEARAELERLWGSARVAFGDLYSAVCRPGSWEFQLDVARACRQLLSERGYSATLDPDASWRLEWAPGGNA